MNESEHFGGRVVVHAGDCLAVARTLADCSFDAVVTDPPYGIQFMGKTWDATGIANNPVLWSEVLRVLKPGGHMVAFSGTRTYHRMACAIEDAGFEVRDQLAWTYGQGFPKSLDVSKAIDKAAGAEREVTREASGPDRPRHEHINMVAEDSSWRERRDNPATAAARQWSGWGTALKPAWEPICLARKPLSEPTVAANVLRWGTGAINVDGCRVGTEGGTKGCDAGPSNGIFGQGLNGAFGKHVAGLGRWPANLIHDGSQEVLDLFPETRARGNISSELQGSSATQNIYGKYNNRAVPANPGDEGSAARFFYTAKADADNRLGSRHPTVKPLDLMQWLARLVTPPGGTVLDPFAGTGATGEAAWREGFRAVLIEREPEYCADIARRMAHVLASSRERSEIIVRTAGRLLNAGPLFAEATL